MHIKRPLVTVLVVFLLITTIYKNITFKEPYKQLEQWDRETVSLAGIVSDKEVKGDYFRIHLKNTKVRKENAAIRNADNVIVYFPYGGNLKNEITIGSELLLTGSLCLFEHATNEGEFDAKNYWAIRKYSASVFEPELIETRKATNRFLENLWRIKQRTKEVFFKYMDEDNAGSLCAIVLGDKTSLNPETKNLFAKSGIAHVLSLSGLHIASIGLLLYKLLKRTGLPLFGCVTISFVALSVYGIFTGLSTSTLRALIMYLMGIIADVIERSYDLLSATSLACILILLNNSDYIFDSGFQLSFASVAAIGFVTPAFRRNVHFLRTDDYGGVKAGAVGMLNNITGAVCVGFAISLVTLPIVSRSYFAVPVFGILLNIIVVPLMSVLLMAGFVGAIMGWIPIEGFDCITKACLYVASVILNIYENLAGTVSGIKYNSLIVGKPNGSAVVCYYIMLSAMVVVLNRMATKTVDRIGLQIASKMLIFVLLALMYPAIRVHPQKSVEIRNIDVGQGDACAVWGKDTPVILIDGGSSDKKEVGINRIRPVFLSNGISSIDYCFVTHPDEDHISGILDILQDETGILRIKNVILSKQCMRYYRLYPKENENLLTLIDICKRRRIPVLSVDADDGIIFENRYLLYQCISPQNNGSAECGNESSTVILLCIKDSGFTALFTGDIDDKTEEEIISCCGDEMIHNADYLKVAHHGSKSSTSMKWLNVIKPKVAVISVGENNRYNHPNPETLNRLSLHNTRIFRTDMQGEVIFTPEEGKLTIRMPFELNCHQ